MITRLHRATMYAPNNSHSRLGMRHARALLTSKSARSWSLSGWPFIFREAA
jgi:hypothetical protein